MNHVEAARKVIETAKELLDDAENDADRTAAAILFSVGGTLLLGDAEHFTRLAQFTYDRSAATMKEYSKESATPPS